MKTLKKVVLLALISAMLFACQGENHNKTSDVSEKSTAIPTNAAEETKNLEQNENTEVVQEDYIDENAAWTAEYRYQGQPANLELSLFVDYATNNPCRDQECAQYMPVCDICISAETAELYTSSLEDTYYDTNFYSVVTFHKEGVLRISGVAEENAIVVVESLDGTLKYEFSLSSFDDSPATVHDLTVPKGIYTLKITWERGAQNSRLFFDYGIIFKQ